MKLFIWRGDGVLTSYTSGLIVALAEDLEGAHRAIEKSMGYKCDAYPHIQTEIVDLGDVKTEPRAWYQWGSS